MRARSPVANFIFVLIDNVYASEVEQTQQRSNHKDCEAQGRSSRALKLKIKEPG